MITGVALAACSLVALTACGGSSASPAAQPAPGSSPAESANAACPATPSQLLQRDNSFSPRGLQVTVGTKVTVTNCGQNPHTWTSGAAGFDSGTLPPTKSFSFTFTKAGTFSFLCQIHSGMVGSITVA